MKAIIFGINGQDGYYLDEILKTIGIEVIGVSRTNTKWVIGNVNDYEFVFELIKEHKPKYIFHLAANSVTQHEFLFEHNETITKGSLNILEATYQLSPETLVFLSGSGLQFKNTGKPIKETDEFIAQDSYSLARIQSVFAARYYRTKGLKVYVGYFFNHDSPLRSERHVNQKIIQAAKRIKAGNQQQLELGNIHVRKEFSFAGDIAQAIWIFINNKNNVFEATIGSGEAFSLTTWLDIVFQHFALDWKKYIVINSSFKSVYNTLVADSSTINNLGWKPLVTIDQLAKLMIDA